MSKSMLDTLKFVKGAVATKTFIPELTHFVIEDGFIRSYNGTIALCAPIDVDINCMPKAVPFVKAIERCEETVTLSLTPSGKLSIRSGTFKAYVECIQNETVPHAIPEGEMFDIKSNVVFEAFESLLPFIGDDASRPWSNGILLKDSSAYATCNVVMVERWLPECIIPNPVCIPKKAITELLRVKEIPIAAQCNEHSITFLFNDKRWIRTNLLSTQWPWETIDKILNQESKQGVIPTGFFEGLKHIQPFADKLERVYFRPNGIKTALEKEEGASFTVEGFEYEGVYSISMLLKLENCINSIDFSKYPNPCLFYGDLLRGAIIGMNS